MIQRLFLKELVTFKELELEFHHGLVVFSGPSGAGKSVLISSILSSFGHHTQGTAKVCEVTLKKPVTLQSEAYDLEDEISIKTLKKDKLRYFIDAQSISKKSLYEMFSPYVNYLCVRDKSGFESTTLIHMLDTSLKSHSKVFKKLYKEYQKRYVNYQEKVQELNKIKENETKLAELIEYATYEVEKISKINPQIGEDEELLKIKKQLSRLDKIKASLASAMDIFTLESAVEEVYRLLEKDSSVFIDAMNQVRADFEETENLASELEELDVEYILNRLSDITSLQQRYGSIEEALKVKESKEKELAKYKNIKQDKSMLENFLNMEYIELSTLARQMTVSRKEEAKKLEKRLEAYLKTLKLPLLHFSFSSQNIGHDGADLLDVTLGGSTTNTLSGGEFNRVRLALMASTTEEKKTIKSANSTGMPSLLEETR